VVCASRNDSVSVLVVHFNQLPTVRRFRVSAFRSTGERWLLFAVAAPGAKSDTSYMDGYGMSRATQLNRKGAVTPLPPASHTSTDDFLWSEGDVVELTLNCEARTLRIKSRLVDHTIPDLPAGQTWVPMVNMYAANTAVEMLP